MKKMRFIVTILFILSTTALVAQIKLPRLISDGVVLQRDEILPLWGWASAGEEIKVHLNGNVYSTTSGTDGKWRIALAAQPPGGPYEMMVTGKDTVTVKDVLFGDVWLCSGQSNMEIPMERVKEKYAHIISVANNSRIRQFTVPDLYDFKTPHTDYTGGNWITVTPQSILSFSAVAYFFARDIYEKHQVPIGLVNAALGGSPAEAWISESALKSFPTAYDELQKFKDDALIKSIEEGDRNKSATWYRELNKRDPGLTQTPRWSTEINASDWKEMSVPGNWPEPHNGSMWFRKEVEVPTHMIGQQGKLWLGRLIDQDSVFINGKFVATTSYQYPPRRYDLSPNVLRAGKNEIVIRMISASGVGGFVPGKRYYLAVGKDTIDLTGKWKYKSGAVVPAAPSSTFVRWKPGGLFNKMISPLVAFPIKGVLWYQGESNTSRPNEYAAVMKALIADWRAQWGRDLPFLFVQLPNYMEVVATPTESEWAQLREAQRQTLQVPNTAMAVAIDAGEFNDIHPLNKEVIGKRLALLARKVVYGESNLVAAGPDPLKAVRDGKNIRITFKNAEHGLAIRGGKSVGGIAVSADGKTYQWASAQVRGNIVEVKIPKGLEPRHIRYAWANNPDKANLINNEGLPATPFHLEIIDTN